MSRARTQRRKDARGYLIAPPGTPVNGPGWHKPPAGMTLTWDGVGKHPGVAVKRGGMLLATGLPPDFSGVPAIWDLVGQALLRTAGPLPIDSPHR